MRPIVVGTAGHIDHGKSTLVEALTGIHPDRLAEEKRRGITIELGFADLPLPPDGVVGFVDVPGHERFVRHMVAGATGFDAAMLVVAADEGVKPQTREHLAIMSLLGLRHGFVALTKADLVEPDLLELAALEVREFVAGSFLEASPVVATSARTGAGLDDVRAVLRALLSTVPRRTASGVPRLAVDRSFAMKGFGTVLTGTLTSGTLRVGDEIEMLPTGARGRIRGLQVHKNAVTEAAAGSRLAINVQGVPVAKALRGSTLTAPSALRTTRRASVRLDWLPDSPERAKRGGLMRVHHGTAETEARLRVARSEPEAAEIHFPAPVVLVPGDRFVLRRPEPFDTIGGGIVVDAHPPRARRGSASARGAPVGDGPVLARVARAGAAGVAGVDVAAELGWSIGEVEAESVRLEERGEVVRPAGRLVAAEAWSAAEASVLEELARSHRDDPLRSGVSREALRRASVPAVPAEPFRALLEGLLARGEVRLEGDRVAAGSHRVVLAPDEAARYEAIDLAFRNAGLDPPDAEAVGREHGGRLGGRLLALLLERGRLVRIVDGRLFHADALEEVRRKIRAFGRTSSTMDVAAFKDLAGVTRKNAIPLLEQLDAEHVTRRIGNLREILTRDATS